MIKGCANITGGGLVDNLSRIIPKKHCADIDLTKVKTLKIFKWLKKTGIDDNEMLKTFNCGIGFCLIINSKNKKKIIKNFEKKFQPYEIGKITKDIKRVKLSGKIRW